MEKTDILIVNNIADILSIAIGESGKYTNGEKAKQGIGYRRYKFNNIGFKVDDSHPFNAAFDRNKDFAEVRLLNKSYEKTTRKVTEDGEVVEEKVTVPAYELVSFITRGEMREGRLFEAQMKAIDKLATAEIDSDSLKALMASPI